MALIHQATIVPTKLELLAEWLPRQGWAPTTASAESLSVLGAFRFDDPAGQTGIETIILSDGSQVIHVPLTYRAEPLDGAVQIGTLEHSTLGTRYVYDATTDPAYLTQLINTVLDGGSQADEFVETDSGTKARVSSASAHGTGVPSMGSDIGVLKVKGVSWVEHGDTQVVDVVGCKGHLDQTYKVVVFRTPAPVKLPQLRLIGEWTGGTGSLATVAFAPDSDEPEAD